MTAKSTLRSENFLDLLQNFDENLTFMFPGPQEQKSRSKIFTGILYVWVNNLLCTQSELRNSSV